MFTTLLLVADRSALLHGSFLLDAEFDSLEECQSWFEKAIVGMPLDEGQFPVGITFENKTIADIDREFPHYSYAGQHPESQ